MPWLPVDDSQPALLDWWMPFFVASRNARKYADDRWALDPLDFKLIGCLERRSGHRLWVYVHRRGGGELCVDHSGRAFRVTPDRLNRLRCKEISITAAIFRTGAFDLDEQQDVGDESLVAEPEPPPRQPDNQGSARNGRHLRVVPGG